MSPQITIHFEFGFTLGGRPPKTIRIGTPTQHPDQPPPVPRKDTIKRRSGRGYVHAQAHRTRPQQQLAQQQFVQQQLAQQQQQQQQQPQPQQPPPSRPQVTVTIPQSSGAAVTRHDYAHRSQPHAQPHHQPHPHTHRSRRHHHSREQPRSHHSRQLDGRIARGRSAPPDAYPTGGWTPLPTTKPQALVSAEPRRHVPDDDYDIPVMRFRLGDPDMPWTPQPEFGEDGGTESDNEYFATRRVSCSRDSPSRPENELRLISRHSAPMVLTADTLLDEGGRDLPSRRHLSALQDALMTVDSGVGYSGETAGRQQPGENRGTVALGLANVPSTALSHEFSTSLAMWNQDHRVIMSTTRERAIAQSQSHSHSQNSASWVVSGPADDDEAPRETGTQGLISPLSFEGAHAFGPLDGPRRYSATTEISAA